MKPRIEDYLAERDEMLRALDVEKFHTFYRKHDLPMPPEGWLDQTIVPLIMMHKCRLQIATMTPAEKEISREWLLSRGYTLPEGAEQNNARRQTISPA